MRLPAATRLEPSESLAPGEGERGPGVLFGARKVAGHAEIGEVELRRHLLASDPVAPGDGDCPLEERHGLLGAPGPTEKNGLRIEA